MPLILNIETSTDICSIGLSRGDTIVALSETKVANAHAKRITLAVDACCKEAGIGLADLDAVAVSMGPGSYTGLRIGLSTAKGICYSMSKPLIPISTLAAVAEGGRRAAGISDEGLVCPMIDARRMEVYTALYSPGGREILAPHALILENDSFKSFFDAGKTITFCGNGAAKVPMAITHQNAKVLDTFCSARHMAPLAATAFDKGLFGDIAYATPYYIKAPHITKAKKRI